MDGDLYLARDQPSMAGHLNCASNWKYAGGSDARVGATRSSGMRFTCVPDVPSKNVPMLPRQPSQEAGLQ